MHVAQHVDSVTGHWGSVAVASGVEGMLVRAFRVTLPSGVRYWTVVDDGYRVVGDADEYLQHLRSARIARRARRRHMPSRSPCICGGASRSERDWRTGAERLGGFITWLKHTPSDPDAPVSGPGIKDVRGPGRINRILARCGDSSGTGS